MILEDSSAAEDVLLEVQRLWPPFLGGARVCTRVSCEFTLYIDVCLLKLFHPPPPPPPSHLVFTMHVCIYFLAIPLCSLLLIGLGLRHVDDVVAMFVQACAVAGYSIPEGAQVAYISHSANRDAAVFPRPDDFYPERWKNE